MWREESGIMEMLFTYIGDYQVFTGWSSLRSIVVDILSCHEEVRRQSLAAATAADVPPMTAGFCKPEPEEVPITVAEQAAAPDAFWSLPVDDAAGKRRQEESLPLPSRASGWQRASGEILMDEEEEEEEWMEAPPSFVSPHGRRWERQKEETKKQDAAVFEATSKPVTGCHDSPKTLVLRSSTRPKPIALPAPNHIDPGRPFACNFCPKSFMTFYLKVRHERTHTGEKPYACNFCSKRFARKDSKMDHERIHTGGKPYSCSFCHERFARRSCKVQHEQSEHGQAGPASPVVASSVLPPPPPPPPLPPVVAPVTVAVVTAKSERSYACKYCSETFNRLSKREKHERSHVGVKPFSCKFCCKSFKRLRGKKTHEKIFHTGDKPYQCNFCSRRFPFLSGKVTHERSHTGEKPYQCSFCSKPFTTNRDRTVHERIHTGEKPLSCKYCAKRFSNYSNKIVHERIHTNEKPYECRFCAVSFRQLSGQRVHERKYHPDEMVKEEGMMLEGEVM